MSTHTDVPEERNRSLGLLNLIASAESAAHKLAAASRDGGEIDLTAGEVVALRRAVMTATKQWMREEFDANR